MSFLKCPVLNFFNDFLLFPRNFSLAQNTRSKRKVLTLDFEMTSSWLNWWFEYGKILKILILENFGKIRQTLFKMPRRQTRCPDIKQDAQMPRRQTRCPDVKQDAQMLNKMPRQTKCPDVQWDAQENKMPRCPGKRNAQWAYVTRYAQMSHDMPRCHTRCPDVTRDAQGQISLGLGILASGHIESGHLGILSLGIWAYWVWAYWVWASGHIESGHLGWHLGILSLGIWTGIWAYWVWASGPI